MVFPNWLIYHYHIAQINLTVIILLVNHIILLWLIVLLAILLLITSCISPFGAIEISEDQYGHMVNVMLSTAGVLFWCYTDILVFVGGSPFRMFGGISTARIITAEHIASLCIPMLGATLNELVPLFPLSILRLSYYLGV